MIPGPIVKPSEVELTVPPLVGTFGKSEAEHAAALVVRACQGRDEWAPASWPEVVAAVKADVAAGVEPMASLARNPFFRPDPHELVRLGFASWVTVAGEDGCPRLELTPEAINAIGRRWGRRAP